jgi:hypothetical protein
MTMLAGCMTATGTNEISGRASVSCQAFEPIEWSSHDTPQTIAAVKEHNAAYKSLCGR